MPTDKMIISFLFTAGWSVIFFLFQRFTTKLENRFNKLNNKIQGVKKFIIKRYIISLQKSVNETDKEVGKMKIRIDYLDKELSAVKKAITEK